VAIILEEPDQNGPPPPLTFSRMGRPPMNILPFGGRPLGPHPPPNDEVLPPNDEVLPPNGQVLLPADEQMAVILDEPDQDGPQTYPGPMGPPVDGRPPMPQETQQLLMQLLMTIFQHQQQAQQQQQA